MPYHSAKPDVANMFDRISSTYDLLNRVFSVGVDRRWRKNAIHSLHLQRGESILDCSAGTGDMAITVLKNTPNVNTVLLDPARSMLVIARSKLRRYENQYQLLQGAAESLPFLDHSFDHFMVAFGIRNFADLKRGMTELHRILKPGGTGVILEFTPDRSKFIDRVFRFYMWGVMQPLGGLISRDRDAYAYLARTIENFPVVERLHSLFSEAGFSKVESTPLSFGIASRFLLSK
jgi:demethylmenaquinone methyltransferase / 2-methoxy-6-polyprenyl-1,4-benzoquinol methylase